ncbi:hypothetical protein Ccrd_009101 [Cynara cardunculus var. scolymus]|uniref:Uncharacterized protein n=1 Tax=Cynara cardunculus var. scolymus TaxID=59895 RepID=A0A103YNU4_CYNCS|nr:hypothetical protein Ccrd_009101 [Cynara cardunculus var. scolymus]
MTLLVVIYATTMINDANPFTSYQYISLHPAGSFTFTSFHPSIRLNTPWSFILINGCTLFYKQVHQGLESAWLHNANLKWSNRLVISATSPNDIPPADEPKLWGLVMKSSYLEHISNTIPYSRAGMYWDIDPVTTASIYLALGHKSQTIPFHDRRLQMFSISSAR